MINEQHIAVLYFFLKVGKGGKNRNGKRRKHIILEYVVTEKQAVEKYTLNGQRLKK